MRIRCDYDGMIPSDFAFRLKMVSDTLGLRYKWARIDRTRHGYHMEVEFRSRTKISPVDLVLVQALLGSDWKRECFNARRARSLSRQPAMWRRAPRWNVLYIRHRRGVSL